MTMNIWPWVSDTWLKSLYDSDFWMSGNKATCKPLNYSGNWFSIRTVLEIFQQQSKACEQLLNNNKWVIINSLLASVRGIFQILESSVYRIYIILNIFLSQSYFLFQPCHICAGTGRRIRRQCNGTSRVSKYKYTCKLCKELLLTVLLEGVQ